MARFNPSFLRVALLGVSSALFACEGSTDASSSSSQAVQYQSSLPSVGVGSCDAYLAQYESCVISSLPQWQQNQALSGLRKTRDQWVNQADTPFKKEALARVCTNASESARQEFNSWSCSP